MRKGFVLFMVLLLVLSLRAQEHSSKRKKIYKLNYAIEAPASIGLYVLNYYGLGQLKDKRRITEQEILHLDKSRVLPIDKLALSQSVSQRFNARNISDWAMNITLFSPVLLVLDKKIRKDWLDIAVLYLETQAINANIYTWGGPMYTERVRPLAYYDAIPMEERMQKGSLDSFFSGHASWTAGATFFMAKVISDYHPELGSKKWMLYAAAIIPPAFVGYHRVRGLKHFPTDVTVGTAVGALVGFLNPYLHKQHLGNRNMSIAPLTGGFTGLALRVKF